MKEINEIGFYRVHDKDVLMVGDKYRGSPMIMWPYDILLGSKKIIDRYKDVLIPKIKGHKIVIKYV